MCSPTSRIYQEVCARRVPLRQSPHVECIAMPPSEVTEKLGLHRMRDRSWYVHPRYVIALSLCRPCLMSRSVAQRLEKGCSKAFSGSRKTSRNASHKIPFCPGIRPLSLLDTPSVLSGNLVTLDTHGPHDACTLARRTLRSTRLCFPHSYLLFSLNHRTTLLYPPR